MLKEHPLHFGWIDVLAAAGDEVIAAVEDVEEPVLIKTADVAGVKPAVADGASGCVGVIQVAGRHGWAGDKNLTGLATPRVNPQFGADERLAGGTSVGGGVGRRERGHLAG